MDPYYATIFLLLGCAGLATAFFAIAGRNANPAPRSTYALVFAILLASSGIILVLLLAQYMQYI